MILSDPAVLSFVRRDLVCHLLLVYTILSIQHIIPSIESPNIASTAPRTTFDDLDLTEADGVAEALKEQMNQQIGTM